MAARPLRSPSSLRFALVALVTAAGAAWLAAKGPVKVIVGTVEIDEFAPTWYMLSAFPALGLLVADGVALARRDGLFARTSLAFAAAVALLVVVGNLRLGVRLPISGHVQLFAFVLVWQVRQRPWSRLAAAEFAAVALLFVAAAAMKLLRWHDPLTFAVGAAAGSTVAYFLKIPRTPPETSAVTSRSTAGKA